MHIDSLPLPTILWRVEAMLLSNQFCSKELEMPLDTETALQAMTTSQVLEFIDGDTKNGPFSYQRLGMHLLTFCKNGFSSKTVLMLTLSYRGTGRLYSQISCEYDYNVFFTKLTKIQV
jgi:hypothetical protein